MCKKWFYIKCLEKREIFKLGSNFWLKDGGELSIELKKPFQILQKGVRQTKSLYPSLEPLENGLYMPKKAEYDQLISIWSFISEAIRTYFKTEEDSADFGTMIPVLA